jgi:hypothetical protein
VTAKRPICKRCGKFAYEIDEYRDMADALHMRSDDYVMEFETTMDHHTLQFLCTPCWLRAGEPLEHVRP